jgi:VWFA-related protein
MRTMPAVPLPRTLCAVVTVVAAAWAFAACRTPSPKLMHAAPAAQAAPIGAPAGTAWFIFVDDLHLNFLDTGRLRTVLRTISKELIHDGDVFAARSSGPSSLSIDLTADRTLFERAIRSVAGNALKPSDIIPINPITLGAEAHNEVRYRASVALSAAYAMMMSLDRVSDRRKAFIYVSNGYDFEPSPDSTTTSGTSPFLEQRSDVSVARLRDQLSELTRMASRASVTIFAIDPRGLARAPAPDPAVDGVVWQNYWTTTRNSLRAMSERTGGFALLDDQDLIEALKRISNTARH